MMHESLIKGLFLVGVLYLFMQAFLVFTIRCIIVTLMEARTRLG